MARETTLTKDELFVDDVRFTDVILIQTRNSVYKFSVGEALKSCGKLIGGAFKECAVEAALCATHLKVGTCARLLVTSGGRCKVLRTSIIKSLTHISSQTSAARPQADVSN